MPELLSGKEYLNTLNNTLDLIMGDWSDDGHGETETVVIKSNLNHVWMSRAYDQASAILGFCFVNDVATEYEEPYISMEAITKLREILEEPELLDGVVDNEAGCIGISTEEYLDIYLKIIKLGEPDFKYEILGQENEVIKIGGYGLFQP
jgi:hypothetical protein